MLKSKISVAALLLAVCLYDDVRLFTKPREDWRAAAVKMKQLATPGTCLLFNPVSSLDLYLVFEKSLAAHQCDNYALQNDWRIVVATSPYGRGSGDHARDGQAEAAGFREDRDSLGVTASALCDFTQEDRIDDNQPAITVYRRK
jgi:hypothetical protein